MSKASDNETLAGTLQYLLNQRGENLVVDNHGGARTMAALHKHLPDLKAKAAVAQETAKLPASASNSAKHYALAAPFVGIKEQPGKTTHPLLVPMFDLTPTWLDRDDSVTAWCGIFRGWLGHKAGTGLPADHYRAANWLNWGTAVDLKKPATWQKGDTVVMKRTGGFHVCLLDRVEGSNAWCLGGNQSNAVTIAKFAISGIIGVRR